MWCTDRNIWLWRWFVRVSALPPNHVWSTSSPSANIWVVTFTPPLNAKTEVVQRIFIQCVTIAPTLTVMCPSLSMTASSFLLNAFWGLSMRDESVTDCSTYDWQCGCVCRCIQWDWIVGQGLHFMKCMKWFCNAFLVAFKLGWFSASKYSREWISKST